MSSNPIFMYPKFIHNWLYFPPLIVHLEQLELSADISLRKKFWTLLFNLSLHIVPTNVTYAQYFQVFLKFNCFHSVWTTWCCCWWRGWILFYIFIFVLVYECTKKDGSRLNGGGNLFLCFLSGTISVIGEKSVCGPDLGIWGAAWKCMLQTCYSLGNYFLAAGCNDDLGVTVSLVSAPLWACCSPGANPELALSTLLLL